MLNVQQLVLDLVRSRLRRRYPDLSPAEITWKMLPELEPGQPNPSGRHDSPTLQRLILEALTDPDQPLQQQRITEQAARLGEATLHLWHTLARKAAAEAARQQERRSD